MLKDMYITIKIFYIFVSDSIRMSRKSVNFDDRKINKIISIKTKNYLR